MLRESFCDDYDGDDDDDDGGGSGGGGGNDDNLRKQCNKKMYIARTTHEMKSDWWRRDCDC